MDARLLQCVAALGAVLLAGCVAAAQSVIELMGSARVQPGSSVVLSQVATLTGEDAIALGGVSIGIAPSNPGGQKSLSIQELRRQLEQTSKVNWGRVTIRGSRCTIQAIADAPAKTASKAAPAPVAHPIEPNSVRAAVSDRIARILQAEPADLRLTFAPEDEEILSLKTGGRTLEVKPTAASDKLPLALTLFERDRIIATKTIRVGVQVRKTVVVASQSKSRGDTISAEDVSIDEQWVGPNLKAASPDQVIGAASQGKISAGQIIGIQDVAPAIIVTKGEQVSVSCVSGTVVVTTKARAMANGRIGEVIQFQALDDKRTFSARMNARGRAVVTVDSASSENRQ